MTTETTPQTLGESLAAMQPTADAEQHFNAKPKDPATSPWVSVTSLNESPSNPRKKFEGLNELAESIKRNGLLVPLLVREVGSGSYEVVAGHRRLRAAKLAGLDEVPVDVRNLTDVQVIEAQLVENIQRTDLTPLEEADGYAALKAAAGYSVEQIAQKAGKSPSWVHQRLKLQNLCPEGRASLEREDGIDATLAVDLARIPAHKDQAKALAKVEGMATRAAQDFIRENFCVSLKSAPFDKKDDMLVEDTPACIACPKRSGSGTPGLFDSLVRAGGDWCTDVKCYGLKSRATWEVKAKKLAAAGAEVLSIVEGAKLFKHENALGHASMYVEADAAAPDDKQKRTWSSLLDEVPDDDRPKLFVAPDSTMKPRRLFVRVDALHAISKHLKLKWADEKAARDEAKVKRTDPKEQMKEKEARELRDEVVREVVFKAAAQVRREGMTAPLARLVARAAIDHNSLPDYWKALGKEPNKAEKLLTEESTNGALAFVTAALLHQWVGQTFTGFDENVAVVAKAVGLDVEKMVKAKLEDGKEKDK